MLLLQQDRRANLELLEANKAANAEEIKSLREGNKDLRVRLTRLQKDGKSIQSSEQQIADLQKEVVRVRSEHDGLKVASGKYKAQLKKVKDEGKSCELESRRRSQEDPPLSHRIRMLENRLEKGMIKCTEAQNTRHTYEHILKRLKDERMGFDKELAALRGTLQSKGKDYGELLVLSGAANHARDISHQELHKSRAKYEEQRARLDSQIRERQQLIKVRKHMLERQRRIDDKRKEMMDKRMSNDNLDSDGEFPGSIVNSEDIKATIEEEEGKIDTYENAFRRIKEATGVSDVNEVIQKIIGQEGTTENLMELANQNQSKMEELIKALEDLRKSVEEVKYNSGSGNGEEQMLVNEKEQELAASLSRVQSCKLKCDRLRTVMIGVKAGVRHLQDKVDNAREESGDERVELTDETIVDVLQASGQVLHWLLQRLEGYRSNEEEAAWESSGPLDGYPGRPVDFDALGILEENAMGSSRPFNQRINIPSAREDAFEQGPSYEDSQGDIDEDELSRDRVKKASSQIVLAQERTKGRLPRRT